MTKILHGDNTVASRKQLGLVVEGARKRGVEITRIDGSVDLGDLLLQIRSSGLFSQEKLVVVEDFFSYKGEVTDELKNTLDKARGEVVFWEGKEIGGKKLESLKKIAKEADGHLASARYQGKGKYELS